MNYLKTSLAVIITVSSLTLNAQNKSVASSFSQSNDYEAIQKSDAIYSFTVNKSQPLFVSLDFYP